LWRYTANGGRTARALTFRPIHNETRGLARTLTKDGIIVGPSDTFLSVEGRRLLETVSEHILQVSRSQAIQTAMTALSGDRMKKFLLKLVSYPRGVPADDELLKLALDRKLLETVAFYLGLWPCLYSIGAWLNFPTDDPPELSQLWHRDPEDLRQIKVFIYLDAVDDCCGPFSYIPATHAFGENVPRAATLAGCKRVPDQLMEAVFARDSWRVCTGPAHTMILADTIGLHRGGKPSAGRRIVVTFTYTSATPIRPCYVRLQAVPSWISSRIQRDAVSLMLQNWHLLDNTGQRHLPKTSQVDA